MIFVCTDMRTLMRHILNKVAQLLTKTAPELSGCPYTSLSFPLSIDGRLWTDSLPLGGAIRPLRVAGYAPAGLRAVAWQGLAAVAGWLVQPNPPGWLRVPAELPLATAAGPHHPLATRARRPPTPERRGFKGGEDRGTPPPVGFSGETGYPFSDAPVIFF